MDLFHNRYLRQTGTGPTWKLHIRPCQRNDVGTYHEELLRAAELIYENSNKKIKLLFSGGIDSEYMINVFRSAKIPFEVAIITYNKETDNWNNHDTIFAFEYCKNNNIDPIVVDVDLEGMLTTGRAYEIAKQTKCCSVLVPMILEGISKLDGDIIMASGEPHFKNYDGEWMWYENERYNSYARWYKRQGINGTPDFLRYTAESMLAFMLEPRVIDLVNNKIPGKMGTRTSKNMIYGGGYTYVPRQKYHGGEIIKETPRILELKSVDKIGALMNKHGGEYCLSYHELLKKLVP